MEPMKAQPEKQVTIFVNTEEHEVDKGEVSYEELVQIALPDSANDPDKGFTISYRRGPSANEQGSLAPGQSVKVKNRMIFDVTSTTRS